MTTYDSENDKFKVQLLDNIPEYMRYKKFDEK